MIKALVEYEDRVKDQDLEEKFLTIQKKSKKKGNKDGKPKKPCGECGVFGHDKDHCYFIYSHRRPKGWKPSKGKKHLIRKDESQEKDKKETKPIMVASLKVSIIKSLKTSTKDDNWGMDSGSDVHITFDRDLFDSYKSVKKSVMGVQNTPLEIRGTGTVTLQCNVEGIQKQFIMQNVHYCLDAEYNFFSIGTAKKNGFKFIIKDGRIKCHKDGEVTLSGLRHPEGVTYTIDLCDQSKIPRASDSGVS